MNNVSRKGRENILYWLSIDCPACDWDGYSLSGLTDKQLEDQLISHDPLWENLDFLANSIPDELDRLEERIATKQKELDKCKLALSKVLAHDCRIESGVYGLVNKCETCKSWAREAVESK